MKVFFFLGHASGWAGRHFDDSIGEVRTSTLGKLVNCVRAKAVVQARTLSLRPGVAMSAVLKRSSNAEDRFLTVNSSGFEITSRSLAGTLLKTILTKSEV